MTAHHSTARARGMTFTDLLAALAIVLLVTGWAVGQGPLLKARETANRVKCMSNLRQLGTAMMLYANDNKGAFPRTLYKPDDAPTFFTGVDAKNPFAKDSTVKPNDVTAALFLLLRTQELTADTFVCPSTDRARYDFGGAGKTPLDVGNFTSEEHLSYSVAVPYAGKAAISTGYKWNNTLGTDFAKIADMNPGTAGGQDVTPATGPANPQAPAASLAKANSLNHRGFGHSVLFGDGHVEWAQTPFVGTNRDNIYTVAGSNDGEKPTSDKVVGLPMWRGDSVMLPTATTIPHQRTLEEEETAEMTALLRLLPDMKSRIVAIERAKGETPETRRLKHLIDAVEAADANFRAKEATRK
ncbi:MAG TPA: hypothetical protein VEA69_08800 [Tepidisphaeraceae bacterium]|nr:hypothetical protein [Tepidisphaeraceae bacterium]